MVRRGSGVPKKINPQELLKHKLECLKHQYNYARIMGQAKEAELKLLHDKLVMTKLACTAMAMAAEIAVQEARLKEAQKL